MTKGTDGLGIGRWATHELSRSAGSLRFDAGVPVRLISEMLGHSSERVTSEVYVHTEQSQRARVANVMSGVLWGAADERATPALPPTRRAPGVAAEH